MGVGITYPSMSHASQQKFTTKSEKSLIWKEHNIKQCRTQRIIEIAFLSLQTSRQTSNCSYARPTQSSPMR